MYIDRITGELLGSDGTSTNNLRVIDIREWNYVIEEKAEPQFYPGIKELHENSFIITINENQIQKEIQKMAEDSFNERLENQVFIVLNVNTGKVFARRDWIQEGKTNREITINTYSVGSNSAPRIAEGLMLLAQLHSHPKENNENRTNIRFVSKNDISVAKKLRITVFAIDTFSSISIKKYLHFKQDSFAFHMHSTKNGQNKKFVGQTIGKYGLNTFNFTKYLNTILRRKKSIQFL